MKTSIKNTTVKDIAYLVNSACLRAPASTSLERLAEMLCTSHLIKVYLENGDGQLVGTVQAKSIAMKILELSRNKADSGDMLPAISYVLNYYCGDALADAPVTVRYDTSLSEVLEKMQSNAIREIAVVNEDGRLIGTLEAKHILVYYLRAKAEASL